MKKRLFTKSASAGLSMFLAFLLPTMALADTLIPVATSNQSSSFSINADPVVIHAVNAEKFGLGGKSRSGAVQPLTSAVAVVTIFASASGGSSGYVSGHAFITVKNISGGTITIGKFSGIANNATMSLGTWSSSVTSEHNGLWYDLEAYKIYKTGDWSNRKSASYIMTATELATLNNYIVNHDSWTYLTNCSSFASAAWNATVAPSYDVSAGIPNTPSNLQNSIMSVFPSTYQTGAAVPWNYIVYYAQGTGTPLASTIYI